MERHLISELNRGTFIERKEIWDIGMGDAAMEMVSGYNLNGDYIGNLKDAEYLCDERGISPELIKPSNNVCSIGWCEKDLKWFGWSHRAIAPFDTRDEAVAFAEEVS